MSNSCSAVLPLEGGDRGGSLNKRDARASLPVINDSPIDYIIENTGREGFYDEAHVFTVKAGSTFTLLVKNVQDPSQLRLTFRLLNTYVAPREHLQLTFADAVPN